MVTNLREPPYRYRMSFFYDMQDKTLTTALYFVTEAGLLFARRHIVESKNPDVFGEYISDSPLADLLDSRLRYAYCEILAGIDTLHNSEKWVSYFQYDKLRNIIPELECM